jgi:hypothetical protein
VLGGGFGGTVSGGVALGLGEPVSTAVGWLTTGLVAGLLVGARRPRIQSLGRATLVGGAVGAIGGAAALAAGGGVARLVGFTAGGIAAGFALYVKLHNDSLRPSRPAERP